MKLSRREQMQKACKRWRQRNAETMVFLNRRNKRARLLMVQWVKQYRPDVYDACHAEAKRQVPISDLAIEKEMAPGANTSDYGAF